MRGHVYGGHVAYEGGSGGRVRALGSELRRLHDRIRDLLDDARDGLDPALGAAALGEDLTVRCRAVCTTLDAHHRDENAALFPWLRRERPELDEVIDRLEQDHAMIGTLLAGLDRALREGAGADVVMRHLEGVDAVMESHFRYEERALGPVLDTVALDAVQDAGPPLPQRFWSVY